jgi:flagellar hook-associated protein 1 FlgK
MSSIYTIMNTAKWALLTHEKSLQVTSHNIANLGTPGYSRQELILETTMPLSSHPGQIGTGVRAVQVRRVYDRFLESQIGQEMQALGRWQAREESMDQVSAVLNEAPDSGLNARMAEFWAAWEEVANNPSGQAERVDLVMKAQSLAQRVNQIHSGLTEIRHQMDESVLEGLNTINSISGQIASLNEKIAHVEASGQDANDYRDKREQLLKDLSEMIDFNSFEESDGKVSVLVAGGKPVVMGNTSFSLQGETNASGFYDVMWNDGKDNLTNITSQIQEGKLAAWLEMRDDSIQSYVDQINTLAATMIQEVNRLHSDGVGLTYYDSLAASYAVDSDAVPLASAASGLPFWDEIVEGNGFSLWVYDTTAETHTEASITIDPGDTLEDLRQKIDAVGGVSATISNGRLTISANTGYQFHFSGDDSNVLMAVGMNTFFDGSDASDMAVNGVIQSDGNKIAAAVDHDALPGDNRNALAISDLQDATILVGNTSTFDGYFNSLVGTVGASSSDAKANVEHQTLMVEQLENRREQISGVSLDEEMTNLMKFQHAYDASAQMIRVVDEMLDTIIELV